MGKWNWFLRIFFTFLMLLYFKFSKYATAECELCIVVLVVTRQKGAASSPCPPILADVGPYWNKPSWNPNAQYAKLISHLRRRSGYFCTKTIQCHLPKKRYYKYLNLKYSKVRHFCCLIKLDFIDCYIAFISIWLLCSIRVCMFLTRTLLVVHRLLPQFPV